MNLRALFPVFTFGLALTVGAVTGWLSRPLSPTDPIGEEPTPSAKGPLPLPTVGDLGEVISKEHSVARQFALAAGWPPPHDTASLPGWLDRIARLPHADLREFAISMAASKLSTVQLKDLILNGDWSSHWGANSPFNREWVGRIGVAALGQAGARMMRNWNLIQTCARADARGTLEFARKNQDLFADQPGGPGELIRYAVDNWPAEDAGNLPALLNSLPESWRRIGLDWLAQRRAKTQSSEEAIAAVLALPAGERASRASRILESLESNNPGGDLDQLIASAPEVFDTDGWKYVVAKWSQKDPTAAHAWLDAHAGDLRGPDLRDMKANAAGRLALTDAEAAYAIINGLTNREGSRPVVDTAVDLARSEPAAALRWLARVPAGVDRQRIFDMLEHRLGDVSPEIIDTLLAGLPADAPASTRSALTEKLTKMTTGPPDLSTEVDRWIKSAFQPDGKLGASPEAIREGQDSDLDDLLDRFAGNDSPEAVETWIAALPDPDLAAAVAARQTWHLMLNDPARADLWLNSLPPDSALRASISKAREDFEKMLRGEE